MIVVYVKLLDEGTVVFRPAQAEHVGRNIAKLLPVADYNSRDEKWEFPPGTIVRYENRALEGETVPIAIAKVCPDIPLRRD